MFSKKTVSTPCSLHNGSANYGLVLDPFWADFPHVSRCLQTPDWFTHPHLFSSSNQNRSFSPSHPIDARRHVAKLHSCVPLPPLHILYIHAPTTVSPGGHRSSVGGEHRCYPILEPHPHPIPHSPPIIFVHPDPPIPSHPAPAGRTAVGQWYLLPLTSKRTVQSCSATMREGKTDIVVKWWPSFLHFRWSASTPKFPILHIKKVSTKNTSSLSGSSSGWAAAAERKVSSNGIWCSFKQLSRLQRKQSLFRLCSVSNYCKNTTNTFAKCWLFSSVLLLWSL